LIEKYVGERKVINAPPTLTFGREEVSCPPNKSANI